VSRRFNSHTTPPFQSQILRFAAALCPRSVLTTGVGTSAAGLTCAAVREGSGKEFSLEAGALVLADKGICCIDEFGCIRSEDRTSIHEAMEQQTLSVAKAGIVCKLNCRATIIAVMNPKNCIFDNHASLTTNTGLGTPLLSRFDLIFKLVDTSDAERDSNVTTYLLNRAIQVCYVAVSLCLEQISYIAPDKCVLS
jgi:DNA helicase MCM9